jgi:hypothetical protein
VERCIGLCVKGLESCRAAAGTATTSSERFVDLLLLAGVGAWAYHLWQPGSGSIAGEGRSKDRVAEGPAVRSHQRDTVHLFYKRPSTFVAVAAAAC